MLFAVLEMLIGIVDEETDAIRSITTRFSALFEVAQENFSFPNEGEGVDPASDRFNEISPILGLKISFWEKGDLLIFAFGHFLAERIETAQYLRNLVHEKALGVFDAWRNRNPMDEQCSVAELQRFTAALVRNYQQGVAGSCFLEKIFVKAYGLLERWGSQFNGD